MRTEVVKWVREHGKVVDPALWKSEKAKTDAPRGFPAGPFGPEGMNLYDCRAELKGRGPERVVE